MRILASLLGLTMLLAACGGGQQVVVEEDPATLGVRTFMQWCVPCHGAIGQGNVNALEAPPLNADGDSYLLSDDEIMAAIIDGGAESGGAMVPLGDQLSPEQEAAVLEYVHRLWSQEQRDAHEAAGLHTLP